MKHIAFWILTIQKKTTTFRSLADINLVPRAFWVLFSHFEKYPEDPGNEVGWTFCFMPNGNSFNQSKLAYYKRYITKYVCIHSKTTNVSQIVENSQLQSTYKVFFVLRPLPDRSPLTRTNTTEAICEFFGLKMVEKKYPVPVQANCAPSVAR